MKPKSQIGLIIAGVGVGLIGLLISAINLFWGELNQDEGWYLYAARATAAGQQAYRDFAFTQGPVFPQVYAWIQPGVEAQGLLAGRIFTSLMGLGALLAAAALAARLSAPGWKVTAALITFGLLWLNVYHSYYSLVVKTYSLTALFIALGALALLFAGKRHGLLLTALAGCAFALAAGVRLSAGVLLPVVGVGLLLYRARFPHAWLAFGVGGVVGLLLALLPAFLRAPDAIWFWLVGYHAERAGGDWIFKAGFISRFVQAYFVPLVLLALLPLVWWFSRSHQWKLNPLALLLAIGCAAVTLIHFIAPFPYDDYQVIIMPVLVALIAAGLLRVIHQMVPTALHDRARVSVLIGVLLATLAAAGSAPMNQQWFIQGRDRIWWPTKETADLTVLRQTADWLREQSEGAVELLTQDTYLAIAANMDVPPGLELGPFSYYPEWPDDKAHQRHVMNRARMLELLASSTAEWAAFSDYGLAIASPDVEPVSEADALAFRQALDERYELIKVVPHFGQAHTPLRMYRLRKDLR